MITETTEQINKMTNVGPPETNIPVTERYCDMMNYKAPLAFPGKQIVRGHYACNL